MADRVANWKKRTKAKHYVYALIDPRDGAVRYIGCTMNMRQRLLSHINDPMPSITDWIGELLSLGLRPGMKVLDEVDGFFDAGDREEEIILQYAKELGPRLLNRNERSVHVRVRSADDKQLKMLIRY